MVSHGRVRRGYLGIAARGQPVHRRLQYSLGLNGSTVVCVESVEREGPASRAGLRKGDMIYALGEHGIATVDDIHRALNRYAPGTSLELKILRGGKTVSRKIVLGES